MMAFFGRSVLETHSKIAETASSDIKLTPFIISVILVSVDVSSTLDVIAAKALKTYGQYDD